MAGFRAVRALLTVDFVEDGVLADEARNHARPAAVRIDVVGFGLEHDRLIALVRLAELAVVLPPLAVLVVPARILGLEPLEVFIRHGVDAPVIERPAGGEELRDFVHVVIFGDALPGQFDEVVRDLQTVLLERDEIAAIVVVIDPAAPHLRVALAAFAAIFGAVFDERPDRGVDDAVVVPPRVAQIAFEQLAVAFVGQRHEQDRIAVADVP